MGAVDGVMTLSAAQALFYNQTALILSGLPNTTQYITYPPQPKAGSVTMVRLSLGGYLALATCHIHIESDQAEPMTFLAVCRKACMNESSESCTGRQHRRPAP